MAPTTVIPKLLGRRVRVPILAPMTPTPEILRRQLRVPTLASLTLVPKILGRGFRVPYIGTYDRGPRDFGTQSSSPYTGAYGSEPKDFRTEASSPILAPMTRTLKICTGTWRPYMGAYDPRAVSGAVVFGEELAEFFTVNHVVFPCLSRVIYVGWASRNVSHRCMTIAIRTRRQSPHPNVSV